MLLITLFLPHCCVWQSRSRNEKTPACIYKDRVGYVLDGDVTIGANTWTARLKKTGIDKVHGMDVYNNINVQVEMINENALRIYMYPDKLMNASEIPDEALTMDIPRKLSSDKLYNVSFTTEPVFGIVVERITNSTVKTKIIDTTVTGTIFSRQFMQLTTRLSSGHVYGFGEHNHRRFKHDMDWKTWPIFTRDVAPVDEWNLYGAHPVYLNLEEDGKANMVFLKNSHAMDVVLQPEPFPAISWKVIGGVLDFYVFLGPSPHEAVQQYISAIGKPLMPSYWSLGFHLCKWGYENLTVVQDVVERNKMAEIPQDVGIGANETIIEQGRVNSPGYEMYKDGIDMDVFVKNHDGTVLKGEVRRDDTVPTGEVRRDYTVPKGEIRRDDTVPKEDIRRDDTVPKEEIRRDDTVPKGGIDVMILFLKGKTVRRDDTVPKGEVRRDDTVPKAEVRRDYIVPKGEVRRDDTVPKGEVRRDDTVPKGEVRRDDTVPKGEVRRDDTVPKGEVRRDDTVPKGEIRRDDTVPKGEVRRDDTVPKGEVRRDDTVPKGEVRDDDTVPKGEIRCDDTVPKGEIRRDHTVPKEEVRRDDTVPKGGIDVMILFPKKRRDRRDDTVPKGEVRRDDTVPKGEVRRDDTVPKGEVRRDDTVPKGEVRRDDTVPKREVRRDDTVPKGEVRRDDTVPKGEVRRDDTVPKGEIRRDDTVPKGEVRRDDTVPKGEVRRDDTVPKGEIRRDDTVPKGEVRRDDTVPKGEVWPGLTAFPDFSHTNATDYWIKYIKYFYDTERVKIDGLWIDMNEPASFVQGSITGCLNNTWNYPPYVPHILDGHTGSLYYKTICMDSKQKWGNHYETHSLYGHAESMVTYRAMTTLFNKTRPFIMTRSSFAGTGKYSFKWLGDNQSQWRQIPWSIIATQNHAVRLHVYVLYMGSGPLEEMKGLFNTLSMKIQVLQEVREANMAIATEQNSF
ncbi:MGAM [Mytilus edulis]|uniref:MGAM n=1 Tax=Mytilus edulis TaxID=6550 RepID=A0A8S3UE62_MYTED|nr:MGAM [Mytilus edulis]